MDLRKQERAEIVRIIEEGIYTSVHFEKHTDKRLLYLEENVLPTLVPALEELLTEVAERQSSKKSHLNPIDWLAQFLMRNNPRYNDNYTKHPFAIIASNHVKQMKAQTCE
ncbi:hypothetical protein DIPPA_05879 [Diplonema papillatum]|nr:hypothetical protein DIPPA_05879 [Diplonema papillatum]